MHEEGVDGHMTIVLFERGIYLNHNLLQAIESKLIVLAELEGTRIIQVVFVLKRLTTSVLEFDTAITKPLVDVDDKRAL